MIRIIGLIVLILLCPQFLWAAKSDYNTGDFESLSQMSGEKLVKKGMDYLSRSGYADSALVCFSIVANRYYEKSNDRDIAQQASYAMNNLGYMYLYIYFDYEKSYNYLLDALKLAEEKQFDNLLPSLYVNLGNIAYTNDYVYHNKSLQRAIDYYKKGFSSALSQSGWELMLVNYCNLVMVLHDENQSMEMMNDEWEKLSRLNLPDSVPLKNYALRITEAHIEYSSRNYERAAELYEQAIELVNVKEQPERYIMNCLSCKIDALSKMGKMDEVLVEANRALSIAQVSEIKDVFAEMYGSLSLVYERLGDSVNAQHYDYLRLKAHDDMFYKSKLLSVEQLNLMRQLQDSKNHVQEQLQKRREQGYFFVALLIFALLICIFTILLLRKNKKLWKNNRKLYEKNLEILRSEEEERQRRKRYEQKLNQLEQEKVQQEKMSEVEVGDKKYQGSSLDSEVKEEISRRILEVMENVEHITYADFSLNTLADLVNSKYRHVSQVINECYGKNFNQLLSEYRIKEACRRLNDVGHYGHYSIEGIAMSVGFKSRSNFVVTFKNFVGLTPSEYRQMAHKS